MGLHDTPPCDAISVAADSNSLSDLDPRVLHHLAPMRDLKLEDGAELEGEPPAGSAANFANASRTLRLACAVLAASFSRVTFEKEQEEVLQRLREYNRPEGR